MSGRQTHTGSAVVLIIALALLSYTIANPHDMFPFWETIAKTIDNFINH